MLPRPLPAAHQAPGAAACSPPLPQRSTALRSSRSRTGCYWPPWRSPPPPALRRSATKTETSSSGGGHPAAPGTGSNTGSIGSAASTRTSRSSRTADRRCQAVIHIRVAEMEDYWPAADLHCRVFSPEVSASEREAWKGLSLVVDRVLALQINDKIAGQGGGNSALLLAFDGPAPATPEQVQAARAVLRSAAASAATRGSPCHPAFPKPMFWLGGSLAPGVRPGLGVSAEAIGLVGVAAVDSFGDLVPPRELNWRTDGQMGWYRREGYAYVSNVAVSPAARRRGVARQLMAAAEAQAAEWGCRAVGLHCNPKKEMAWSLYESLGYKDTGVVEPALMPYLHGRPPDRCCFLLKLVPSWWRGGGEAAGKGAAAAGGKAGGQG